MADEVHDLVVSIRPDGADDTADSIRAVGDEFEDTTDDIEDASGEMNDFAKRFKGAASIVGAAISTAAVAVGANIPAVQQAASEFQLTMNTLFVSLDDDVRPAVEEFNDEMREARERIREADTAPGKVGAFLKGVIDGASDATLEITGISDALDALAGREVSEDDPLINSLDGVLADKLGDIDSIISDVTSGIKNIGNLEPSFTIDADFSAVTDAFEAAKNLIQKLNELGADIEEEPVGPGPDEPRGPVAGDGIRRGMETGGIDIEDELTDIPVRTTEPPSGPPRGGGLRNSGLRGSGVIENNINIDSRTVAKTTKPFTVRGALRAGRGARLR